jgi:segregation and condensation protein B
MSLISHIEAILFVASKPLTLRALAKATDRDLADVTAVVEQLQLKYTGENNGIRIFRVEDEVQMGTAPELASAIEGFVKSEIASELTKAQLETLTVIGYRGPITRPELEQIRGVNCALIIRNLLMRGLIVEDETANELTVSYRLSLDALRHLGITAPQELPEYSTLHAHDYIERALGNGQESSEESVSS